MESVKDAGQAILNMMPAESAAEDTANMEELPVVDDEGNADSNADSNDSVELSEESEDAGDIDNPDVPDSGSDGADSDVSGDNQDPEVSDSPKPPDVVKIGDEEVPFDTLKQTYQQHIDYQRELKNVTDTRVQLHAQHAKAAQDMQQQYNALSGAFNEVVKIIAGDAQSPDMLALKQTDRSQWTFAMMELSQRHQHVTNVINALISNQQQFAAQQQQQQDSERQALQARELDQARLKIKQDIPDWDTPTNGVTGAQRIKQYLQQANFTDDEINQLVDPRMVIIAENARKYDELKNLQQETKTPKKSRPVSPHKGKADSQRGRKDKRTERSQRHKQLVKQAKQSGSYAAAGVALMSSLNQGK